MQALYMNHSLFSLVYPVTSTNLLKCDNVCFVSCRTNNIMKNLRFSQQRCWRFKSSGILCHVAQWVILTFQRLVSPSSSKQTEGTIILQNVWSHSPSDTAAHSRSLNPECEGSAV